MKIFFDLTERVIRLQGFLFFFFFNAFFYFILHVFGSISEFPKTSTHTSGQFRYFFSTK